MAEWARGPNRLRVGPRPCTSGHRCRLSFAVVRVALCAVSLCLLFRPSLSASPSPRVSCLSKPNTADVTADHSLEFPRTLSRHLYSRHMLPRSGSQNLVFFAVNSARGNSILRDVIRRTWGAVAKSMGFHVKFFVGHSQDMLGIEIEKAKNNDVVVLDVDEGSFKNGYNLLSRKTMLLMQWVDRNTDPSTLFMVKVDDDVYFDVEAFVARIWGIKEQMSADDEESVYYGYINEHSEPIRDATSKWYEGEYRAQLYPPYAAGIFYMLSRKAVSYLTRNAKALKQWRNEDASVGTWLYATKTRRIHDQCVYPSRSFRAEGYSVIVLHMAMSTNVKTSRKLAHVKNREFDMLFTASLMNAAHRHLQEFGTILGVCKDSVGDIDEKVEASNVVYMTIEEWVLERM